MNLRIVTIGSVFFLALVGQAWISAADQHGIVNNPLRGSGRDATSENGFHPFAASLENTSPPRSPPELWRNPGSLRTDMSRGHAPPNGAPMSADRSVHDTQPRSDAQPPRTLIQRIRDRRLLQLEKQAERLRELSERDAQRPDGVRHGADPNGPENLDLQIDLGVPGGVADPADADLPLIGPVAAPNEMRPEWAPHRPSRPAEARLPDLNPPADPPIEIQIDLPGDGEPPQPKPTAQSRIRNWRADPLR